MERKAPPRPANASAGPSTRPAEGADVLQGNALDCSLIPTATVQSLSSSGQDKGKKKGLIGNLVANMHGSRERLIVRNIFAGQQQGGDIVSIQSDSSDSRRIQPRYWGVYRTTRGVEFASATGRDQQAGPAGESAGGD